MKKQDSNSKGMVVIMMYTKEEQIQNRYHDIAK